MKLIELVNSVEALNHLSETKLPGAASFSVAKFLKEATPDLETYNKVRSEKVKEYGTQVMDEKGSASDQYSFSEENGKKFIAEMTEIENRELDIKIPEFKVEDLKDSVIEPKYLVALNWLIKE